MPRFSLNTSTYRIVGKGGSAGALGELDPCAGPGERMERKGFKNARAAGLVCCRRSEYDAMVTQNKRGG